MRRVTKQFVDSCTCSGAFRVLIDRGAALWPRRRLPLVTTMCYTYSTVIDD